MVANGQEVIDAFDTRTYDLVLMDVRMPVVSGLEATRHIRSKLAVDRQPYIIAVTADDGEEQHASYFNAGMDDVIAKPVKMQCLQTSIGTFVSLINKNERHLAGSS